MNLEIYNRKDFLSKPNLDEHTIEYYSNVKGSRFDNVEFKGFIEFDYNKDTRYSYYGETSIDDKYIYLAVKTFEYNESIDSEKVDLERFIDNKLLEFENFEDLFNYDEEDFVLFYFN